MSKTYGNQKILTQFCFFQKFIYFSVSAHKDTYHNYSVFHLTTQWIPFDVWKFVWRPDVTFITTLYTIANRLQIRKHFILKSFQSGYNNNVNKRGLVTLRVTLLNMFKSKASVVRIIVSGFLLVVIQSKVTECNTEEVKVMSKEERLYLQ